MNEGMNGLVKLSIAVTAAEASAIREAAQCAGRAGAAIDLSGFILVSTAAFNRLCGPGMTSTAAREPQCTGAGCDTAPVQIPHEGPHEGMNP